MTRTVVAGRHPSILAVVIAGALVSGVAWAAPGALPIPLERPGNEFRVHTIDVDQGQAVLVQTLGGKNILIDAGEDYAAPRMIAYLKKLGVQKIDWLMISHRHMDHIGGVFDLAQSFPVENVVTPWAKDAIPKTALVWMSPLRKDLSKPATGANATSFFTGTTGKTFDFGNGAQAEVVWPPKATGQLRIGDYNEESMVVRVSQAAKDGKKASFVAGGDLGWQLEKHLAKTAAPKVRADGMIGDHHGSLGSFECKYISAVLGQPTKLVDAIDSHIDSAERKMAHEVIKRAGTTNGKELATSIGLALYTGQRQQDPLVNKLADYFKQPANGARPWITYSAGNDNPYSHPNTERMALASLIGTTFLGTDMQGNIIMVRKTGADGKWAGSSWAGHTISQQELPLPDVHDKMPAYKRIKDTKHPYDQTARIANYIFELSHPDPVMKWGDKATLMPPAGQEANTKFLAIAREARHGRRAFVDEFRTKVEDPAQKEAVMREALTKVKTSWHGVKLETAPWIQEEPIIASVKKIEGVKADRPSSAALSSSSAGTTRQYSRQSTSSAGSSRSFQGSNTGTPRYSKRTSSTQRPVNGNQRPSTGRAWTGFVRR
jgi:beta-lactamase superfamily II metal-dependent hydrolase